MKPKKKAQVYFYDSVPGQDDEAWLLDPRTSQGRIAATACNDSMCTCWRRMEKVLGLAKHYDVVSSCLGLSPQWVRKCGKASKPRYIDTSQSGCVNIFEATSCDKTERMLANNMDGIQTILVVMMKRFPCWLICPEMYVREAKIHLYASHKCPSHSWECRPLSSNKEVAVSSSKLLVELWQVLDRVRVYSTSKSWFPYEGYGRSCRLWQLKGRVRQVTKFFLWKQSGPQYGSRLFGVHNADK